jgi:uncharacterized protein YbcI
MVDSGSTRAQKIGRAVSDFERQRTGRPPQSLSVILDGETLLVTLRGGLSPAELELSRTPEGAAQVHELHRQVFASASGPLRQEIERITGVAIREAAVEALAPTSTIPAVPTGTVVYVFLLAGGIPADAWSGDAPDP